ncbi:uncharacterized protein M6B38_159255 [Iris pallida]|nr:uncharacterized protein M6B38_159255 [Iris pallida]
MSTVQGTKWVRLSTIALSVTAAAVSLTAAYFSISSRRRKSKALASRIRELEASFDASLSSVSSERRGRIRAQQELRQALATQSNSDGAAAAASYYPMVPIGTVRSCFSTRNGTPRQPQLVPLSRACLIFDPTRVPSEALEGLADYSHCWVLYVFHMNTNLDKSWKEPSRSKLKAKVRVPRLKGGKMGVFATRSPHRPSPIGLSVAKVEALDRHAILLSGVDLVDGTPVLDIKPYLPFSDCIQDATAPAWIKEENALAVASVSFSTDFPSSLSKCWTTAGKQSLYASAEDFQSLIKQVLSWDIRSLSQQTRPHHASGNGDLSLSAMELGVCNGEESHRALNGKKASSQLLTDITYHLVMEGVDISYRIDGNSNITVENAAALLCDAKNVDKDH